MSHTGQKVDCEISIDLTIHGIHVSIEHDVITRLFNVLLQIMHVYSCLMIGSLN